MAENNFKPFAVGAGANVSSQTDWENLVALSTGFTAGIARSEQINKALRQGTVMASVLGQIILEQTAEDVLDNGDTAALKAQLLTALTSLQIDSVYPVGAVLFFAQNKTPTHFSPGRYGITSEKTKQFDLDFRMDRMFWVQGSGYGFSGQSKLTCTGIEYYRNCCFSRSGHKTTDSRGAHSHGWGSSMQKQGGSDQAVGSNGGTDFGTTSTSGAHTHSVALGSHSHSVSGNTENMGSGTALNITNAYVKLMGWYRSA